MENFSARLFVRVSDADKERARALSESLGLSVSELVRLLLQLPANGFSKADAERFIVLDLITADKMYRELRHWGYQRNQGMHALNSIVYYLRANKLDEADVMDGFELVSQRFDAIEQSAEQMVPKVDALAQSRFLFR